MKLKLLKHVFFKIKTEYMNVIRYSFKLRNPTLNCFVSFIFRKYKMKIFKNIL